MYFCFCNQSLKFLSTTVSFKESFIAKTILLSEINPVQKRASLFWFQQLQIELVSEDDKRFVMRSYEIGSSQIGSSQG